MVTDGATVTGIVAETPAYVATIFAEPGATAATWPSISTVATPGASDWYVI
jgi:hypothetical protein